MPAPIQDGDTGLVARTAINKGFTRAETLAADYTLTEDDDGKLFFVTASLTVTLPDGLTDNFAASFRVAGEFTATFTADTSLVSQFTSISSYEQTTVVHVGSNEWYATGDL
jgi:hypothetical protein